MLRSIAGSLLSVLVVITFLWGGCVSCEQYFMFPGRRQPCCNRSGQCERPGKTSPKPEKQDCNRLPLHRGGNPETLPLPAVLPTAMAALIPQLPSQVRVSTFESRIDPSPPDIPVLNVTFLI